MKESRFSKFEYSVFCLIGVLILFFTYFPYLSTKVAVQEGEQGSISGYFLCGLGEGLTNNGVTKLAQISILFVCLFVAIAVLIALIMIFSNNDRKSNANFIATIIIGVLLSLSLIFSICAFASILSLVKQIKYMQAGWAIYVNFTLTISLNIIFWTFLIIDLNEKVRTLQIQKSKESLKNKLQELNTLKEESLITDEEYEALKKSYLNRSFEEK